MFDSIIEETNERYNLNGKAETLLSALLTLMTDKASGGLTGFLERFNQVGLNDTTSSWVDSGANIEISSAQLESALGADTLDDISNQLGTEYDTTKTATAFMIPRVVDALTPDGNLPQDEDLLSKIGGIEGENQAATSVTPEEIFDRIGTAAVPVLHTDRKNVNAPNVPGEGALPVADRVNADIDKVNANSASVKNNYSVNSNSPLAWILPLLLLGLMLVLGYWFCSKPPS